MEDAKKVLAEASKMNGKPIEPEQVTFRQNSIFVNARFKKSFVDCSDEIFS